MDPTSKVVSAKELWGFSIALRERILAGGQLSLQPNHFGKVVAGPGFTSGKVPIGL